MGGLAHSLPAAGPHLVIGLVQVIEVGQMLKRLFREPFKGQASVRALDEGDATGEPASAKPPSPPHLLELGMALAEAGVTLLSSQPVPTGLPSLLLTGPQARRSRWEMSTER